MTNVQFIPILISIIALAVATIFNILQSIRAAKTMQIQQQISRGNVIMSFARNFFDLVEKGDINKKIEESEWAYQYWSLLSMEFYYFHHDILPVSMFSLWMTDLAKLYSDPSKGKFICESHKKYLNVYSFSYNEMSEFFNEIYLISCNSSDETSRNRKIADLVKSWIAKNKRTVLS